MKIRLIWIPVILLILHILPGCSDSNPVSGNLDAGPAITDSGQNLPAGNNRYLLGYYNITINPQTLDAEVIPLRSTEFNLNLIPFLGPPIMPQNLIEVLIDPFDSAPQDGIFAIDLTINHPFPGLTQYPAFDLRCILMSDGTMVGQHDDSLIYADENETTILNADGWTRWWNPTDFTNYNMIFGYCEGVLSIPGFYASATLNPYKYFAKGLDAEDELYIDPETRGCFHPLPGAYTRRMLIQFEMNGDFPVINFNTAVDCSWDEPDGEPPEFDIPGDFSLDANCQEAYQLSLANAGSTIYYKSPGDNGGDLAVDLAVYDWQSTENPDGVAGEVGAIWVESPTLFNDALNVLPACTISPDGPTSSVFHFEIHNMQPTGLFDQMLLVTVESESPDTYAPNLPGDWSGIAIPDSNLAAYFMWEVPILDEAPVVIPSPSGLDNCSRAGIVELYWYEPTWPTMIGYNLYRKESTEPSYDFGSPLNPAPLTEPEYIDTDVLDDGTIYNYVATTVDSDMSESEPSNETTANPQYVAPSGFTDLEYPDDGTMGTSNVLNGTNAAIDPEGNIYLVWDYNLSWPDFEVKFVKGSLIDGTFGTEVTVGAGDKPDVAFDSEGNAHIAWGSGSGDGSNPKNYHYASVDPDGNVENLTDVHTFTYGNWWCVEPTIAVTPDDEIHIVFTGYDAGYGLLYVHGSPGDFSAPEKLTSNITSFLAMADPDLVCDSDGNLHMIWVGSGLISIWYMKRDTAGVWSAQVEVYGNIGGSVYRPGLAVDRFGIAHVSVSREIDPQVNYPIYINNRTGIFENPVQCETEIITNGPVQVAADQDGNGYVIWYRDLDPDPSLHDWRTFVGIIDRNNNLVETGIVCDDPMYEGVIPTMAGVTDTCYSGEAAVIGLWTARSNLPPQYARIRADY